MLHVKQQPFNYSHTRFEKSFHSLGEVIRTNYLTY